jgi:hypothetical protein
VSVAEREAIHTLEAILHTQLPILEHTTDTHGSTEIVFALFDLLGLRFIAPQRRRRPAPVPPRPAHRLPVDAILRARARPQRIREHYDDLLRTAASLKRGWVPASLLIARLKNATPQSPLAAALGDYGRIVRSNFLLVYCADPAKRARMAGQLNKGETLHALRRHLVIGSRAQIPADEDDHRRHALCLQILVNAVHVWNALHDRRDRPPPHHQARPLADETAIARVAPVAHAHVNSLGRYDLHRQPPPAGHLRPLRRADEDTERTLPSGPLRVGGDKHQALDVAPMMALPRPAARRGMLASRMTTTTTDSSAAPTVDDVRRIGAMADPVVRNLEITHCYGRLSAAMVQRTGPCANWCTYATWASRQAGRTIRGEDLLETLRARLMIAPRLLHPVTSLGRALLRRGLFNPASALGRMTAQLHNPFDAFELTSDAVARGNRKVFEEIGYEFARYLHAVPPEAGASSPELRAFVAELREGEPPDGQRYLAQAFTRYASAAATTDPAARAELLLLANCEIGMHEQTRLQPEIRESLDAPYAVKQDLDARLSRALMPWWRRPVPRPVAAGVGAIGARAQRGIDAMLREVITMTLMVMSLPGRVMSLGADMDEPFPELLRELHDAELVALFARFDAGKPGTAASDWSDFDQRMRYIAHLFRAFHLHGELLGPPFTAQQVAAFTAGTVPDGDL